jgi:hypothetical protein
MTLRDCTLFVQVPKELICDESSPTACSTHTNESVPTVNGVRKYPSQSKCIRIVIADLDEKSEVNRGEYWQSLEKELISGGYYLGKGKLDNNAEDCDLSESIWVGN